MHKTKIVLLLVVLALVAFLTFAILINSDSHVQANSTTQERLFDLSPIVFSTKIDLGMLIAAAPFASTIFYNFKQTRKAEENLRKSMDNERKISEAGFWLTLRDQISRYDDIESNFRPDGKWYGYATEGASGPQLGDFPKVDSYMSLLALLNTMVDRGVLSEEMFNRLYV
jgi:hypothetical protein